MNVGNNNCNVSDIDLCLSSSCEKISELCQPRLLRSEPIPIPPQTSNFEEIIELKDFSNVDLYPLEDMVKAEIPEDEEDEYLKINNNLCKYLYKNIYEDIITKQKYKVNFFNLY